MFELKDKDRWFLAENLIMLLQFGDGYSIASGGKTCFVKKCLDPVTDVIVKVHEITSDDDLVIVARDIFGYDIKETPNIFKRNMLMRPPNFALQSKFRMKNENNSGIPVA